MKAISTLRYKDFLKDLLFLLGLFMLARAGFLAYHFSKIQEPTLLDITKVFLEGIYIDLSAASYLLIPCWIFVSGDWLYPSRFWQKINKAWMMLVLCCTILITFSDVSLYEEWQQKTTYKALSYLKHPTEVWKSARAGTFLISIPLMLLFSWQLIRIYERLKLRAPISGRNWTDLVLLLITPPLLVIGIRGGWQPIPMQQGDVYFSNQQVLNQAAVNSLWNLGHSIVVNQKNLDGNRYSYMQEEEARKIIQAQRGSDYPSGKSPLLLTTSRPNVLIVLLESWSANAIGALGGYTETTPYFNQTCKEGFLFTQCYASGTRSDQGIMAALGGYPSQPLTAIINDPSKYQGLPALGKAFKQAGYHSQFLFGGQLGYGNINAFVYYNGFDKVMEGQHFPGNVPRGRLGVHDPDTYRQLLENLSVAPAPFFSFTFTQSTHPPYDAPMEHPITWAGRENDYMNSMLYADKALHDFLEAARQQSWYNNTLFIFMADHSHGTPRPLNLNEPDYRRIPLLFWGPALKEEFRGKQFDRITSQADFPAILLAQLNWNFDQYQFSRNALDSSYRPFAYYSCEEGLGWVKPEGRIVFMHDIQKRIYEQAKDNSLVPQLEKEGKAYLQLLNADYLTR